MTKTLTLYSPHSGVVTMKKALEGMRVMAGEELLQISDISKIWINADIYEYELPWVKVGQTARVELPFAADKVFEGRITYIYPYLNNETRTARARIELANPGLELKPDMYANVSIDTGGGRRGPGHPGQRHSPVRQGTDGLRRPRRGQI